MQLGVGNESMTLFARLIFTMLSFWVGLGSGWRSSASRTTESRNRTTLDAIRFSDSATTYHFGGSLQTDRSLPANYVSYALHFSLNSLRTFPMHMLWGYMEMGGFSMDVVDTTILFAGTQIGEVPERAIGTVRLVAEDIDKCKLPINFLTKDKRMHLLYPSTTKSSDIPDRKPKPSHDYMRMFFGMLGKPISAYLTSRLAPKVQVSQECNSSCRDFLFQVPRDAPPIIQSIDPAEEAVNELVECLANVKVPNRTEESETLAHVPVLHSLSRDDLRRYLVGSDCSLRLAVARIVQSAAWRGLTFPIDTSMCRIELQNGQFFQQGHDLQGNPVFYFRNMLLGPWRQDENATIAAVLHRLEKSLNELSVRGQNVKCTLIVVVGRPCASIQQRSHGEESGDVDKEEDSGSSTAPPREIVSNCTNIDSSNNPRLHSDERWRTHSSRRLIARLLDLVSIHYPERLGKALVILGYGNSPYVRTTLRAKLALSVLLRSSRTRKKVVFLQSFSELEQYVHKDVLVKFVGGRNVVAPEAFTTA